MKTKPRILFTTPVLKHPPVGGPFLRIENTIKALSQISTLSIYCRRSITEEEVKYYKSFCQNFYYPSPKGWITRQLFRIKRKIWSETTPENQDFKDFLNYAKKFSPDIIWLGYGNISYPLLKYIKEHSDYKVVCDTDSVWSRFILRGLPYAKSDSERAKIREEGKQKEIEEKWGTSIADITTAVSEIDADYYRLYAKKVDQICIFSNVIDLSEYNSINLKPVGFKNPCIYLAGSFWPNSPMDEAARWCINRVLPLVKKQIPEIHFYIIGNNSNVTLNDIKDPSITITGQIPSILPYLNNIDVSLVPLKFESGTRFKILEAGAVKKAVVSTSLGAEGLPVINGENILIADTEELFAEHIVNLIKDKELAEKIGLNLYNLIERRYSINNLIDEGLDIIDNILEKNETI